ncbi:MAG: caspase domain-containing protein, partial [Betaproteobacteria bacterium]
LGALPNPRNDAEAVAAKLRSFGIDVDLVLDTNRAALVKALADYHDRAAGYDVNVLFYAGHGVQMGGINYIVPVDLPAAGATVGSVKLNAVSLNDALEYLPARTRLVFLDACRDNPLSRSLMATRSAALGLAPVSTVSGTLVAYATKDGSTAENGSGRNSPYTAALLEHLDLEEDIAVVLRRARQSVLKATNQRQEPWGHGSLIGDQLVLARLAR